MSCLVFHIFPSSNLVGVGTRTQQFTDYTCFSSDWNHNSSVGKNLASSFQLPVAQSWPGDVLLPCRLENMYLPKASHTLCSILGGLVIMPWLGSTAPILFFLEHSVLTAAKLLESKRVRFILKLAISGFCNVPSLGFPQELEWNWMIFPDNNSWLSAYVYLSASYFLIPRTTHTCIHVCMYPYTSHIYTIHQKHAYMPHASYKHMLCRLHKPTHEKNMHSPHIYTRTHTHTQNNTASASVSDQEYQGCCCEGCLYTESKQCAGV